MFTIGLEFSLPKLLGVKRLVQGLTMSQALLTGNALAMSSIAIAIVLKQLGEQMELPASHGRVATGILLFQDLAVVPVFVAIPILTKDSSHLGEALTLALGKAGLVLVALVLVGRWVLPLVLR